MLLYYGFQVHPWNVPVARPGVYLITHIESDMKYVGASKNVAKRIWEHATGNGNVPQLYEVIKQYSGKRSHSRRHAFFIEPLYYTVDVNATRKEGKLHSVEIAMIEFHNSINHGWNLPHTDIASLARSPDAVAKRIRTEATQDTKDRRSAVMLARWSDIEYSSRVTASIREANVDPERNAKISAKMRGINIVS